MNEQFELKSYDYYLPKSLIAQQPAVPRDSSRLMILDRNTGKTEHRVFADVIDFIQPEDILVLNDTRVVPVRLHGRKQEGTSNVELFLLAPISEEDNTWEALVKPGRRLKPGMGVLLSNGVVATVEDYMEDGIRQVRFPKGIDVLDLLNCIGEIPLPPYIHNKGVDTSLYQTVFAKKEGSSAAPTASLHFTKELLEKIKLKGTSIAWVTLHVGLGTFRPVKEGDIRKHIIHKEVCEIPEATCNAVNAVKQTNGRVIAVGTTVVRTLESFSDEQGLLLGGKQNTDLFIYPGYRYKTVDCMITNFHLPESTLLMLVSAFAGHDNIMSAYNEAVEKGYRFFSFGDAMFII